MNILSRGSFLLLAWLAAAVLALAQGASAQAPPVLRVELDASAVWLVVSGAEGEVCTIQGRTNLLAAGFWQFVTNFTLSSSPYRLAQPSGPGAAARLYRAFSQIVPANVVATNMIWIPPGTFAMGSPDSEPGGYWDRPQHIVTLTHGFYFGKYEVTQGEYLSLMQTNPSFFTPVNGYSEDLARPVEQVSWDDATGYCEQLTQREQAAGRLPSDWTYRLPTEAEWEYACRAGATTAFPFGPALYSGMANFDGTEEYDASSGGIYGDGDIDNPLGTSLGRTITVGSYVPSPWGLADLQGNVSEWCQDWYEDYSAAAAIDPQGPLAGIYREFRGGSWFDLARGCRAAARYGELPTTRARLLGFRLALAQTQQ